MPPFVVLLGNIAIAVTVLAVGASNRLANALSSRGTVLAVLPLLSAALLTLYVFGEDSYRDNGISRWDAYRSPGGALGPMFVASVTLMVACAGLLVYSGIGRHRRLFRSTLLVAGSVGLLVIVPTIIGFSAN